LRTVARSIVLALVLGALGAGAWLAARGTAPDRRDVDALVTVGGDVVRDALHPALDLTRLTDAQEAEIGREIDAEIRAHRPVGGDAATEAYLGRVLRPIVARAATRSGIPYRVAIVRSPEVNAFAVAGGRIYVTEGLLAFVRSEAELAAVLGHEIQHVDLRHCASRLQVERAAGRISPGVQSLARRAYAIAELGYSEEQELEADRNGAAAASMALYDPWEAVGLYERFLPAGERPGRSPTRNPVIEIAAQIPQAIRRYVATHPPADQRIEAVRGELLHRPALWRGRDLYVGRSNLAERVSLSEDARAQERVRRDAPP
jgi:predicted Zn-dependent protease